MPRFGGAPKAVLIEVKDLVPGPPRVARIVQKRLVPEAELDVGRMPATVADLPVGSSWLGSDEPEPARSGSRASGSRAGDGLGDQEQDGHRCGGCYPEGDWSQAQHLLVVGADRL